MAQTTESALKPPVNQEQSIKLLKVISLLLSYPSVQVQEYAGELQDIIDSAREIPRSHRQQLVVCLQWLAEAELMDVQEAYDELFGRGRYLSLLLFEHVHGESRARGQAMVDLMAQYSQKGLDIDVRELPDYLPLYLEYLSLCDGIEARSGLADVAHILGMLSARLQEKQSPYASCMEALLVISGATVAMDTLKQQAAQEKPDDTLEAMDKIWEEEMVTFGGGDGNGTAQNGCNRSQRPMKEKQLMPEPVHFIDASPGHQKGAL